MVYQILKKSNVVELKKFYNNIQNKFQVEAKIPDQIFLEPNEVYVFDLWDFLDENVQYLLDFTKKLMVTRCYGFPNIITFMLMNICTSMRG